MSVKKSVFAATALFATNALSAYIAGEPWADLIPEGSYEGGLTDYGNTFGIAVVPLSPKFTPEHTVTVAKRDYITVAKRDATVSEGADGQLLTESADVPADGGVGQIEDGQVQYGAKKPAKSNGAVGQITDGQVQAVKGCPSPSELESVLATATTQRDPNDPVNAYSYKYEGTLEMSLNDGVLRDARGRIGSIVASRQFQFDGPPPQAGSIYAKGWSLTPDGNLALGDSDVFYRCLSGNFYNLYDQSIGGQCSPVHLQAINLISC